MGQISPSWVGASRSEIKSILKDAGLRPTGPRVALAQLLFTKGNRHFSAEELQEEAIANDVSVSLATIYNTLHQFTDAGLLREVAVCGSRTCFDTNTSDHHHFFLEDDNRVIDIPANLVGLHRLAAVPEGFEVTRIDIVMRLRRLKG